MDRKNSRCMISFFLPGVLLTTAIASSFRGHFDRRADLKLTSDPVESFAGLFSVYDCTALCGTSDRCKSFVYEVATKTCYIFNVSSKDSGSNPVQVKGQDLYERNSMSYFTRISNHHLPINRRLELSTASLEECAWRCISEQTFDCYGFNHQRSPSVCLLLNASPVEGSLPAIKSDSMDFYEKTIDYDPMDNFVNFGSGMLWPLGGKVLYNQSIRGISVEQCAQRCLDDTKFRCASFDYLHDRDLNFCLLSEASVMAGNVNMSEVTTANCNHFERMDYHMRMFQPTLYARSTVAKIKRRSNSTPEDCAKSCVDEVEFICRSFDYQLEDGGACLLSSESTSNEQSIAVIRGDSTVAAHHFKMKPVYECGDNLSLPGRNFFSPGWPSRYAPHEDCLWHISASSNQMITINFFHLELGDGGKCTEDTGDRLLVTELDPDNLSGQKTCCLPSKTTKYVSRSSRVSIRFVSDGKDEDFGFRASYFADWTCNAVLKRSPGEFASSGYPLRTYPPDSRCSWRLSSPNQKHRIRLDFPYFRLLEHPLGHCTESADHVKVVDGGTVRGPVVGIYCGVIPPFFVISVGSELLVQFRSLYAGGTSDRDDRKRGFRALYSFEEEFGLNRTLFDRTMDARPPQADQYLWDEIVSVDNDLEKFKLSMWIVVASLVLISLILFLSLLLMYRYHRKQMLKYEGSFQWPWKTQIVSMKLLRSLKRMRRNDNDANTNNLILNSNEPTQLQDVSGTSTEEGWSNRQLPSSSSSILPKSSGHTPKYQRLDDTNIYIGDFPKFP